MLKAYGVHIVRIEWLVKSAFLGKRLPELDFPATNSEDEDVDSSLCALDAFVLDAIREFTRKHGQRASDLNGEVLA